MSREQFYSQQDSQREAFQDLEWNCRLASDYAPFYRDEDDEYHEVDDD
jgi:hypothetical protein